MRVLVGCERSGQVRNAFAAHGHDAWSCDIAPADDNSDHHLEGDLHSVLRVFEGSWDLGIFHPPCTFLCNSGVRHMWRGKRSLGKVNADRYVKMIHAAEFFLLCLGAKIPRVAVENPQMHGHALAIVGHKADQWIHPWEHGHGETKRTGLWLRGLPLLRPTDVVDGRLAKCHTEPDSKGRAERRSETYPGIARAMAEQWGDLDGR